MESHFRKAIFHLKRDNYRKHTTLGIMYCPNAEALVKTLEDTARPYGIKDKGSTAIPATEGDMTYFLRVRNSSKYGKVVVVFTEEISPDLYELKNGGIQFTQILCHGGNKHTHTMGCILVNKNRSVKEMIAWESQEELMVEKVEEFIDKGFDCRLKISNLFQSE